MGRAEDYREEREIRRRLSFDEILEGVEKGQLTARQATLRSLAWFTDDRSDMRDATHMGIAQTFAMLSIHDALKDVGTDGAGLGVADLIRMAVTGR